MTGWKKTRIAAPLGLLFLAVTTAASAETAMRIRREMTKVESQYFALYNKLNTEKQFDMVCRMEAPTGSNFMRRICQPRYLESAKQTSASERIDAANHAGTPPQAGANVCQSRLAGSAFQAGSLASFRKVAVTTPSAFSGRGAFGAVAIDDAI